MSDMQGEALLQWNIYELLEDVARLKGAGIPDRAIPGGIKTAKAAAEQGYLVLSFKKDGANYFQFTDHGLIEHWGNPNKQSDFFEVIRTVRL